MPSQLPDDALFYSNNNGEDNRLTSLSGSNFYKEGELRLVTDDVFSYMCSLAMEKCSKKSEKKKASCGGAAMRKRLLIKNFVAQMLAQERENNSAALLNSREEYTEDNHLDGSLDNSMEVDMEEDEMDDEEEEDDDGSATSPRDLDDEEDENDASCETVSDPTSTPCPSNVPFSVASTCSEMEGGVSIATTTCSSLFSNSASTFYDSSSRSPVEQWDDFHTVPPTAREYMLEEEGHCQESLLYTLYPQYSTVTSPSNCSPTIGHSTYASSHVMNVGALPDNLLEDISLWEEKKHSSSALEIDSIDINDSSAGCALANLVTMVPSMIKTGCCRTELSQATAYRRCITDLDTNTVVEEYTNGLGLNPRSPARKRPISAFAQEPPENTLCNLMMLTTSPKRVKL